MTTDPSASEPGSTSGTGGPALAPNGPAGPPPNASAAGVGPAATTGSGSPAGGRPFAAVLSRGSASANDFFTSLSATRSCGRLGPARLGSTVARSSSSVSE